MFRRWMTVVHAVMDRTNEPRPSDVRPASLTPPRVLVVDDESTIRIALRRFFTRMGWEVEEAGDGGRALEMILEDRSQHKTPPYSLVVSDLRMPGLSGIQATRAHREGLSGGSALASFSRPAISYPTKPPTSLAKRRARSSRSPSSSRSCGRRSTGSWNVRQTRRTNLPFTARYGFRPVSVRAQRIRSRRS